MAWRTERVMTHLSSIVAAGTADVDLDSAALAECLKWRCEMRSEVLNARAYFACCLTLSDEDGDGDDFALRYGR